MTDQWSGIVCESLVKEYYEEQFCENILNMGQWFRRCHLKKFFSGALAVLLFGGADPFMQFGKRALWGTFMYEEKNNE